MTDTTNHITATREDHVLHLRIDRPAKRNALTMPMFSALADGLLAADADTEVKVVLISGTGPIFCAGHDLEAFAEWPQASSDPVPRFLRAIANLRKPMVMAVQGAAAGIGVTWMLHADWVVSSAETKLRLPFIDLGIAPEAASSILLARTVGTQRARKLLLGGEAFSGADAHAWGLIAELAAPDAVFDTALARARMLASKDSIMLAQIKEWLHPAGEFDARIEAEAEAINAAVLRRR